MCVVDSVDFNSILVVIKLHPILVVIKLHPILVKCQICECRPSCRMFSCRCWKPPHVGGVLSKFSIYTNQLPSYAEVAGLPALCHLSTASLAVLHRHPRYKYPGPPYRSLRSRIPVRCLPSEGDTIGGMQIFAYLRPYLFRIFYVVWTACVCVDGLVSMVCSARRRCFGATPCWVHTLPCRTCIGRAAGRCCRNFISDWSRA